MMKLGLILCEDAPVWGGQVGYGEFYLSRFTQGKSTSEEWFPIYAVDKPLPTIAELKTFTGFVISGAHFSVNDDEEWIRNLEEFVRAIYIHNQVGLNKIHVYGICFGHQLIAKALGGKVALNESSNFIFGAEKVKVEDALREKDFFQNAFGNERGHITMMQSHGERVTEIPHEAVLVGSSETCENEMLMYDDFFLTSQGHPEFTKDVMVQNIVPRLRWTEEQVNQSLDAMDLADTDDCVQMVRNFLMRRTGSQS